MYPVKLGYEEAVRRIETLITNGHYSEALVASVFTVEKTLRRTLRQLIVLAGFISSHADKIANNIRGLEAFKKNWEFYDPRQKKLTEIIDQATWKTVINAFRMRNYLVHGVKVYDLSHCRSVAQQVLISLASIKETFDDLYGYSGWERGQVRKKSKLHQDLQKK